MLNKEKYNFHSGCCPETETIIKQISLTSPQEKIFPSCFARSGSEQAATSTNLLQTFSSIMIFYILLGLKTKDYLTTAVFCRPKFIEVCFNRTGIKHFMLLTRNQPRRAKVSDFICGVGK